MKKILSLLIFFLFPIFHLAGESRGAAFHSDLSAGLDLKYSDNVIFISNYTISNNVVTSVVTTTDSDFIWEPYLTLRFMKKDPLYSQKVSFYLSYDAYSRYYQLNYPTYSVLFEQGIGEKSYLTFKYTLNPYLFVGEQEVFSGGPNVIDTGQNLHLQTFTFSFDKDLPRGFNLYLFGRQALKDYNTPIDYRTAIANTIGGDLTFHLKKETTVLIGLSYEINESKKGFPTVGVNQFDDTDYTSPGINFLGIHHLSSVDTARLKLVLKTRNYSADASDPLHGGRNDLIINLMISNTLKLTPKWSWKVAYELFKRDSNQSYALYTENSLTTGLEYFF
jgi:hypothetical protein